MISEKVANMVKFGSRKERQDKRELLASMKEMNCDDKHNDNGNARLPVWDNSV